MKTLILVLLAAGTMTGEGLSYHGAAPAWIFSGGVSRGTWFNVEDFFPGAAEFTVEWAEIWLYDPPAPVFAEIWSGGESGPVNILAQKEFSGTTIWFDEPVITNGEFWCLVTSSDPVNLLADNDPDGHSFHSDDWLVWEQFDPGEFFISVGNITEELRRYSWAALKTAF